MAVIGIDCGASKMEIIACENQSWQALQKPLGRVRIPTNKNDPYPFFLQRIQQAIEKIVPIEQIKFLGMGLPGVVDPFDRKVSKSSVDCLIGQSLEKDLSQNLGTSVCLENDAKCFAIAEAIYGAAQGYQNVIGLIIGTGVASGWMLNQKLVRGKHGMAGEIGHWVIDPMGAKCYCGNRGCIESLISGRGLERIYQEKSGTTASAKEIYSAFLAKQEKAQQVFTLYWENLRVSLAQIIHLFDPEIIVIGGGMSNIKELFIDGVSGLNEKVFSDQLATKIVKNQLGDAAGVYGACLLNQVVNKL